MLEKYVYVSNSKNLARPARVIEEMKAAMEAWTKAQKEAQETMFEEASREAIETIDDAGPDWDALVAELGLA